MTSGTWSQRAPIAALAVLCPALALGASQTPASAPVTVVNTTNNPVPVTGAVTGTVQLAPGTEVVIGNTVDDPVRVRNVNDALQPLHWNRGCSVSPGAVGCDPSDVFQVPDGKRLVIEYASFRACVPPGQTVGTEIRTIVGGRLVNHALNDAPAAGSATNSIGCDPGVSTKVAAGQQVRIYADGGTGIGVTGIRNAATGAVEFRFSSIGYLVDVPFTP